MAKVVVDELGEVTVTDQTRRGFATRAAAAFLAPTILTPSKASAQQQDINGVYAVKGRNPDGTAYSGRAEITEVFGKVTIRWAVAGSSYDGLGTRDGRLVVVDWGDTHPVVYVVMPDGALHGTWANGEALERLTR